MNQTYLRTLQTRAAELKREGKRVDYLKFSTTIRSAPDDDIFV